MRARGARRWARTGRALALAAVVAAGCGSSRQAPDGVDAGVACRAGDPCSRPDPCGVGVTACADPSAVATCELAGSLADGTPCGDGLACRAGACQTAGGRGTLTVAWRFQEGGPAAGQDGRIAGDFTVSDTGCAEAGVDVVRVVLLDGGQATAPCAGPDGAPSLRIEAPSGEHGLLVQGLRRDELVFQGGGSGVASAVPDAPVRVTLGATSPQTLVVRYQLDGEAPSACELEQIVDRLVDGAGGVVATTEAQRPGQPVVQQPIYCDPAGGDPPSFSLPPIPLGSFRFDYLLAEDGQGVPRFRACSAPVAHAGFPVVVNLGSASSACR